MRILIIIYALLRRHFCHLTFIGEFIGTRGCGAAALTASATPKSVLLH